MRNDVQYLLVRGELDNSGSIHDARHVLGGDHAVRVPDSDNGMVVHRIDVGAGDADKSANCFEPGLLLGPPKRRGDGVRGGLNVYDDAFAEALRRSDSGAEDLGGAPANVGNKRADLRGANVYADYDLVACDRDTSAPRPARITTTQFRRAAGPPAMITSRSLSGNRVVQGIARR